ncbi:Bax inhibitor-1/YccA family protein [Roseibium sp. RKSG952]|uniref:Bax inhibitor-1/YccA family protein n=1 Tax=Roseibium sp. RKSG952 TaxID=2529384 RepID=UPI0012BB7028|nr:Bax inhibitor-1/YccA family protein [Roseibium sp. RKSG952]MTH94822.1 Bax inhibitor-1/YccA family protein [Roseibium sp. RKSG952]
MDPSDTGYVSLDRLKNPGRPHYMNSERGNQMTVNKDLIGIRKSAAVDQGLRDHMVGTYNLLLMGLLVSAGTAWGVGQTGIFEAMTSEAGGISGLGFLIISAPLIILMGGVFSGFATSSAVGVSLVYWLFVAFNGISLGFLASHYSGSSVVTAALGTAIAFGGASLYGYTAKRDLTAMGTFMFMGLVGLIGASLLNLFVGSSALMFATSIISVIVFSGLAAWETQILKDEYSPHAPASQMRMLRTMAALSFYLNVINIFQSLLFLGGDD